MKKAIAIVSKNEKLSEVCKRIQEENLRTAEQIKFLKKRADDLREKMDKSLEAVWTEIENILKEDGLLKDYDPEKHCLCYAEPADAIFMEEKSSAMTGMTLQKLLQGLGAFTEEVPIHD